MAEARNTITFDSIMAEMQGGNYRPIYYLMGDEPYYIDEICNYIANNALRPEERDFNQTVLFGSDVTASTVVDAARRYPMMAERQVVIVKEAQNIKQTDALEKYMKQPSKTTILVLCHKNGKIDGHKKEYTKAIQQAGILFESTKMKENLLPSFIEKYLRERQTTIDPKSALLIAEAIGSDLTRLTSELNKLIISLPENNRQVTPQVVEDQIGVSKDFNGFELKNAIVNRNIFKANQIMNYFYKNPKAGSLYSILPLLFNYFQNLMLAYYCPQRTSQEGVAAWLEMKSPWAAKDFMTGMRNYTAKKVMEIISKMREIDAKSKGLDCANTPQEELMKELIFYILH
jgi:DNA polymerase-3 subunit delta